MPDCPVVLEGYGAELFEDVLVQRFSGAAVWVLIFAGGFFDWILDDWTAVVDSESGEGHFDCSKQSPRVSSK